MWNDIGNAPKDGTKIILLIDDVAISGSWGNFPDCMPSRHPEKGWRVDSLPSHGCGCCSEDNNAPVGWMPMPNNRRDR